MAAPDLQWIADPDIITAAIKLLAGAVITLGGMLVAGGKWIAGYMVKQVNTRMDGMESKLERLASGMESMAMTTSNQISTIEARCEERHKRIDYEIVEIRTTCRSCRMNRSPE